MRSAVHRVVWASALAVACAACAACALGCGDEGAARPNVILVSVDTLRADALGSYGGLVPTPAFDRLARDGVVFEKAFAPAALTAPSHASLLTGTEPREHGVIRNGAFLPADLEMVAEVFQAAGYASAGFVSSFVLDVRFGWDQGFAEFDSSFSEEDATLPKERGNPGQFFLKHDFGGFDRRADASVDAALAWLETAPEPYFLFVHLFDPHDPYVPPAGFDQRLRDVPFPTEGRSVPEVRRPKRLRRLIQRYHAEVLFTDEELGRLFAGVATRSERRRVIALTADHGEGLGQHDWLFHAQNLYEEALHVPLVVHDTSVERGGLRISTPVALADVAPTLLDLAGLPPLPAATGRSLAGSVRHGQEPEPRPIYAHRRAYRTEPPKSGGPKLSVRAHDWKLIRNLGAGEELYDLARDPGELEERLEATLREEPERVAALRVLLDAYGVRATESVAPPPLSDEVREALEALGYSE